jgi:hypothetical protein
VERPGRLEKSESWEVGELPGAPCGQSLGNTILTGVNIGRRLWICSLERGILTGGWSRLTLSEEVPRLAESLTFSGLYHLFTIC